MLLHFHDPVNLKTKNVVYENSYHARDPGTLEHLRELSTWRRAVEDFLNGVNQPPPAVAREMFQGVDSRILQKIAQVERYLPLLENLVARVQEESSNPAINQCTERLRIRWTSALSYNGNFGIFAQRFFQINHLQFELGMVLFLYGALLRERAMEDQTNDLVEVGKLFRKAAGIYTYLEVCIWPLLQPYLPPERAPEATSSMASIMKLICLADAQAACALMAERLNKTEGLLAKLHYGVVLYLEEARNLLVSSAGDWNDVSEKLKKFISTCSTLHEARSQKCLARDFRGRDQLGMAIGILQYAMSRLAIRSPGGEEAWNAIFRREREDLERLLMEYVNENGYTKRETPCRPDELPILEGKKIVNIIVYEPSGLARDLLFHA